jgi:prophage antirepressor-like protein
MSQLIPFQFDSHDVRVLVHDSGEPWWVAKDVCDALGYGNHNQVIQRLDDDEKGIHSLDTLGGTQQVSLVNESGLYNLVLGSKKPEAKAFKRWVTHEVIPAVRTTGNYRSMPVTPQVKDPAIQMIIDMAVQLDEARTMAQEAHAAAHASELVAARAEGKADMAMGETHRYTLEEFILLNGMGKEFPLTSTTIPVHTAWLKMFCLAWNQTIRKAPVLGKSWDNENTYPLQVLAAWLRHQVTKPAQIALVPKHQEIPSS